MAASDITVSGLNKVGAEDAAYLVSKIRTSSGLSEGGHPIPRFHAGVG